MPAIAMLTNDQGRRVFQLKSISWSTRNRGSVQRTHRNTNIMSMAFASIQIQLDTARKSGRLIGDEPPPRKNVDSRNEPSSTYAYSARKKIDHFMPEYSVWK